MIKILNLENLSKLNTNTLKVIKIKEKEKVGTFKEDYLITLEESIKNKKTVHQIYVYDSVMKEKTLSLMVRTSKKTEDLNLFLENLSKELKNAPKNRLKFLFEEKKIEISFIKDETTDFVIMFIEMIIYICLTYFALTKITQSIGEIFYVFIGITVITAILQIFLGHGYLDEFEEKYKKISFILIRILSLICSIIVSSMFLLIFRIISKIISWW